MAQVVARKPSGPVAVDAVADEVAKAYNRAVGTYRTYADGDPRQPFSFGGQHAFADRQVWSVLTTKLRELRAIGATSVSVLDAGCGPGTWLCRIARYANALGFDRISARGFDIAGTQIETARRAARELWDIPGLRLRFDVADLRRPLPEADASVDITLCLYSVLSHLPTAYLEHVVSDMARVTKGHLIATVRPIGSSPTAFIDSIETTRHIMLDHDRDQCDVEFKDGRHFTLPFHLFSPTELRHRFSQHFEIEDLLGLDIFHGRFPLDHRWNPTPAAFDPRFADNLAQLEDRYARQPGFMERAAHLMLVGRHRP